MAKHGRGNTHAHAEFISVSMPRTEFVWVLKRVQDNNPGSSMPGFDELDSNVINKEL